MMLVLCVCVCVRVRVCVREKEPLFHSMSSVFIVKQTESAASIDSTGFLSFLLSEPIKCDRKTVYVCEGTGTVSL